MGRDSLYIGFGQLLCVSIYHKGIGIPYRLFSFWDLCAMIGIRECCFMMEEVILSRMRVVLFEMLVFFLLYYGHGISWSRETIKSFGVKRSLKEIWFLARFNSPIFGGISKDFVRPCSFGFEPFFPFLLGHILLLHFLRPAFCWPLLHSFISIKESTVSW